MATGTAHQRRNRVRVAVARPEASLGARSRTLLTEKVVGTTVLIARESSVSELVVGIGATEIRRDEIATVKIVVSRECEVTRVSVAPTTEIDGCPTGTRTRGCSGGSGAVAGTVFARSLVHSLSRNTGESGARIVTQQVSRTAHETVLARLR